MLKELGISWVCKDLPRIQGYDGPESFIMLEFLTWLDRYMGISADAEIEDIKAAYRRLSKQYHPDTTSLPIEIAAQKFIQLKVELLNLRRNNVYCHSESRNFLRVFSEPNQNVRFYHEWRKIGDTHTLLQMHSAVLCEWLTSESGRS